MGRRQEYFSLTLEYNNKNNTANPKSLFILIPPCILRLQINPPPFPRIPPFISPFSPKKISRKRREKNGEEIEPSSSRHESSDQARKEAANSQSDEDPEAQGLHHRLIQVQKPSPGAHRQRQSAAAVREQPGHVAVVRLLVVFVLQHSGGGIAGSEAVRLLGGVRFLGADYGFGGAADGDRFDVERRLR